MVNIRISQEEMGSDHAPQSEIEGAILAAEEHYGQIILVGDKERLEQGIKKHRKNLSNLRIQHSS